MNKIENWKKRKGFKQTKINSPMLVSLLSFVVCLVMLASCCYAWFTAVQGAKIQIEAGTFGVKAVVSQSDVVGDGATPIEAEAIGNESISIEVPNGNTYQVSLTAIGEASKGFCVVTVTVKDTAGQPMGGEKVYHTGPMLKVEAGFAFTLETTGIGTTEITIQPSWGEYQEESGVVSTLIPDKITVSGDVEAPVMNIAEIAPEETSTVAETTAEVTTEAVATTAEETTTVEEKTAEEMTTEETTEAVGTTVAETGAEVETTEAVETTAAETTAEVETSAKDAVKISSGTATTEAVETTVEETTTEAETTAAESSAEAETTVNATVEATTEAVETAADTIEADKTEALETVETSAEETTAEATTESLSAEE